MAIFDFFKKNKKPQNIVLTELQNMIGRAAARGQRTDTQTAINPIEYAGEEFRILALKSDILRLPIFTLNREIFKKRFELLEQKKVNEEEHYDENENPNVEKEVVLDQLKKVNSNGQSLLDVYCELEDDFNILDDAWLFFRYDYEFDSFGNLSGLKPKELLRSNPLMMTFVMNRFDEPAKEDNGRTAFFCLNHRDNILYSYEQPTCSHCTCKMQPAFFQHTDQIKTYYAEWEFKHRSKYSISKRHGKSPIIGIRQKAESLYYMDKYILEMYNGQRPPKAGLFFNTNNIEGLNKSIQEALQRQQENPHMPLSLGIQNSGSQGDFVKFVDFMKSLDELQHTEMRNEFRRQICAIYGVSPIFQNDVASSGGLNNESKQITVANWAIEYGQSIYNEHFSPRVLEFYGFKGYILKLKAHEEQDEILRLQKQKLALENAKLAASTGLEVIWDDNTGEPIIKGGKIEKETFQPFNPNLAENENIDGQRFGGDTQEIEGNTSTEKSLKFSEVKKKISSIIKSYISDFKKKLVNEEYETNFRYKLKHEVLQELNRASQVYITKKYWDSILAIEKELGYNIVPSHKDYNMIEVLKNQSVLYEAYSGLTSQAIDEVNKIFRDSYKDGRVNEKYVEEQLTRVLDMVDSRAENIARSETGKILSAARKNSYSQDSRFNTMTFVHVGPKDDRTTECCKNIFERTKQGVSYDSYYNIVKEESEKFFPDWQVNKDYPLAHYQCRHTFVRKI